MTTPKRYIVRNIDEMAEEYAAFVKQATTTSVDLSLWLPDLAEHVRPLVPGELVFFMADTGVGKSLLLGCIAHTIRLPSLFLEMELPSTMMYERFAATANGVTTQDVFNITLKDLPPLHHGTLSHIVVCDHTRLSKDAMKQIITNEAREKLGRVPVVVYVDYIGLMHGDGKTRYERMSNAAEQLKVLAKETNTVVIAATQIHRPGQEEQEITLHSAKDSGSIESSAGLLIGLERDKNCPTSKMWLRILKNSKGRSGACVCANLDGARMTIGPDRQFEANTASDDAN